MLDLTLDAPTGALADSYPVLVLNSDGRPTRVPFEKRTWQEAVRGVVAERLQVVSYYDAFARSPTMSIQLPSIVMNQTYVDLDTLAPFNRWNILLAYEFNCAFCSGPKDHVRGVDLSSSSIRGAAFKTGFTSKSQGRANTRFPVDELTFDHIIPASKNGKLSWENIVPACRTCNSAKANRTPAQARMPLRFKPYHPTQARLNSLALIHVVDRKSLHQTWQDYLYWDSNLD